MTKPVEIKPDIVTCDHCGDNCTDRSLVSADLSFCCKGCQTVYTLLQNNGLSQYYDLEQQPGISLKDVQQEKFAYLDEEDVLQQLLDFQDGTSAKVTFYIPDIHCVSCIWLLENLHRLQKGVSHSKVNFLKKEVYVTYRSSETKLSSLAALLHSIGYAPLINLADLDRTEKPAVSKSLYYKLGVTGFIFGNVMFMSFPEYLGLDKSVDTFYFQVFSYMNLILGLPLVFYSGWDYLRSAFLGIQQRMLNIDVPITIGILSLFGRSAFEIITNTGAGYIDSLAGLIFFLLIGKWFQQKTYHSISFERDYQSYFPVSTNKVVNKKERPVSLKKLKAGDRIRVRHQELIPADGILMEGEAYIDYSFVTGESAPLRVAAGELIYAGGRQTGGAIDIGLTKEVVQSYLVQLWNEHDFEHKKQHQHSSQLANKVGKYFTIAILVIAFLTLAYWLPIDTAKAINAFSAVLIIACPCAVALSIPFTFGNVMRLLGRKHFYLKNTGVIENIQNVTHIVFDKTGTLTERKEDMIFHGQLTTEEQCYVKSLASQSSHPRSQQIDEYLANVETTTLQNFVEKPGQGTEALVHSHPISIYKSEKGTAVSIDGEEKGYFEHLPVLRKAVPRIIQQLQATYDLFLLSGDRNRHQSFFKKLFVEEGNLHFNAAPTQKLQFIKNLQDQGATVMMIGDGLNDAGALQQADVGLVISENNNNFSPACDGVLSATAFPSFIALLQFIRRSRWVIYLSYAFALLYNIIGLSYAVQGNLSPVIAAILMPLSSVSIILLGIAGSWGIFWKGLGLDK
ncbi:MAG: heavy metal translocating P-type ATPase [Saprospiraceae bacterium]